MPIQFDSYELGNNGKRTADGSLKNCGKELGALDLLGEFGRSMAYSGFQSPVNALLQPFGARAPQLVSAPREAEYGSAEWYCQQTGSAIGSLPVFLAVSKGIGKVCPAGLNAGARGAITGLVFEGLLRPNDENATGLQAIQERGRNAVLGATTFGVMGCVSESMMKKGLGSSLQMPRPSLGVKTFVTEALANSTRGAFAGVSGGLVSAELQALTTGRPIAEPLEFLRSAYAYGLVGAGMDLFGGHKGREAPPPNPAEIGKVDLKPDTIVVRADGKLEPFRKSATITICKGDQILTDSEITPLKRGGFSFKRGNLLVSCDKQGTLQKIVDQLNHNTTTVTYDTDRTTKQSRIKEVDTIDARGNRDGNLFLRYDPLSKLYYDGLQNWLGSYAKITVDGTVVIEGTSDTSQTRIGKLLYDSSRNPVESVRLERNGLRTWFIGGDVKITERSNGSVLRVSTKNGQADYQYDTKGDLTEFNLNGWRYQKQRNGSWTDNSGKVFATNIDLDANGGLIIRPGMNFRVSRFPGEIVRKISLYPALERCFYNYDTVHNLPAENWTKPVAPTSKQVLSAMLSRGEAVQTRTPGVYEKSIGAGKVRYAADGSVHSVSTALGQEVTFKKDSAGQIIEVQTARSGQVEQIFRKNANRSWDLYAKGKRVGEFHDVSVSHDGSVTFFEKTMDTKTNWTGHKLRPDGLTVEIAPNGWHKIDASEIMRERTRVIDLFKKGSNTPAQAQRFEGWMKEFESRCSKRVPPVSAEEIANTYYQLDRLMSSDNALLPRNSRMQLAEQFMFKAAYPHTIGQGSFNTCNVTAVIEHRFVTKFPSHAVRMVTDAALTGKTLTWNGQIIDVAGLKNVMQPCGAVENRFDPNNFDGRDFFDQLCQTIAVNAHWQCQSVDGSKVASKLSDIRRGQAYQQADIRYELSRANGKTPQESLGNYATNSPTYRLTNRFFREVDPVAGAQLQTIHSRPALSPGLNTEVYAGIELRLRGAAEDHIIAAKTSNYKHCELAGSVEELAQKLNDMKAKGTMPATVVVDGQSALLGNRPGDGSSAHVVNVQNIFERNGKWYIEMTNQWGSQYNYLDTRALPIDSLWEGMTRVQPEVTYVPPDPPPKSTPFYWTWLAAPSLLLVGAHIKELERLDGLNKAMLARSRPMEPVKPRRTIDPAKPTVRRDPARVQPTIRVEPAPRVQPAPQVRPAPQIEPAIRVEPAPRVRPARKVEPIMRVEPVIPRVDPTPRLDPTPRVEPPPSRTERDSTEPPDDLPAALRKKPNAWQRSSRQY